MMIILVAVWWRVPYKLLWRSRIISLDPSWKKKNKNKTSCIKKACIKLCV